MRPLIDTSATAAAIFWPVFLGWGLVEWRWIAPERRERRREGRRRSAADKGTAPLFFLAIYGGFAFAFLAAYRARWAAIGGPRWLVFAAGIAAIVAGVAVRQWAIHTLGRFHTSEVRILEGHTVVTDGPYRVIRHPSYAGGLLSDVGLCLALGNWLSLVIFAGGIGAVMIRRITVEEEALRTGLAPGEYDRYAAGRKRMIPGVW